MASLTSIRAAGGVLYRLSGDSAQAGGCEVALVHRPRYDDWSLPKGKLHRGEHPLVAAGREVFEETGVRPRVGVQLPTVSYPVPVGAAVVSKVVDYWAMTVDTDEGLRSGLEVDAMAWLPIDAAMTALTYSHDREVLAAFAALPRPTGLAIVVRHASAGKRTDWIGQDEHRPLGPAGVRRSARLAAVLRCFSPNRLLAAPLLRCMQTLEPLARQLGLVVEADPTLAELADPALTAQRIRALATDRALATGPTIAVICGQRELIPPALALLHGRPAGELATPKGDGWVLSFAGSRVIAADRLH